MGDREAVDRNRLSPNQLKHLIVYDGKITQNPSQSPVMRNKGIFSQTGMNVLK